ncbi:diacylglycerol kinase [Elusimicrobiota bacterium]
MSGKDIQLPIKSNIVRSLDYALKGLVYTIRTERNMRIHVICAILILMISLFLNLTRMDMISIVFSIALVLIAEMLNTASELMVNLITEQHHPLAKIIKDVTAGAVLFASICAVVVGYLVFIRQEVLQVFSQTIVVSKISSFPPYLTAVITFLVLVSSLFIKALVSKNISLVGGMPSIHSAVAFSLATLTYFLSDNIYVLFISLALAMLVGQTRVSTGIHNIWQVVMGSCLGIGLTVLLLQIVSL